MAHINLGVVAHVDSGKTSLSESILYHTGSIRAMGRVDYGNSFLDTYGLERQKGITIFSKQAELKAGGKSYTLFDTPGHIDFSAEMERTLQVIDYAILIISGPDGIQGHTLTLWNLLKEYRVPVFIFINKMDQQGVEKKSILDKLRYELSGGCMDMEAPDEEEVAMLDEKIMEKFLSDGTISNEDKIDLINERKLFPCYFGSALKDIGVKEFIDGIVKYTAPRAYKSEFGAKVFKITRDEQGNRLTHLKITGGSLKVKENLFSESSEKVNQIRIYSGNKYEAVNEVYSGEVCAVTGFLETYAGQGIGSEISAKPLYSKPVLAYNIMPPEGYDLHVLYKNLRVLEEEEPQLNVNWNEELKEIQIEVMGEIEIEMLKNLMKERFGIEVYFGDSRIVYKETIKNTVRGVGHYEPLKHYAEVHLMIEPLEAGSGILVECDCSEDKLARNWQRLVVTHLKEKAHIGVLTGSKLTDVKITLVAGRAHLKHTEGGDFRQATYRAVRQGLMQADSVLLEPVYKFRIEVPKQNVGRVLTDIQRMNGKCEAPDLIGNTSIITGTAPVATMKDYYKELISFTSGEGKITCQLNGYEPCHNASEVIEGFLYNPDSDMANPSSSVFCKGGAGFNVEWQDVYEYMHIPIDDIDKSGEVENGYFEDKSYTVSKTVYDEKELEVIFERTYGPIDRNKDFNNLKEYERLEKERARIRQEDIKRVASVKKNVDKKSKYLLVDGYNIVFAWKELKELAAINLDSARLKLLDIMCNYQGYKDVNVIVVFDAYKVQGGKGSVQKYNNIYVVYTKEAETADQYIEKTVHEIGKKYDVTVATSDSLEQMIIWGAGGKRLSANELLEEINSMEGEIDEKYLEKYRKLSYNIQ